MFHYIFDYNYGNSWYIMITCVLLETGMNVQTMSLHYVSTLPGKTKNSTKTADRLLQYVFVEQIVPNFHRKFFYVSLYPRLLQII